MEYNRGEDLRPNDPTLAAPTHVVPPRSSLMTTGSEKSGLCPTFLVYTRTSPCEVGTEARGGSPTLVSSPQGKCARHQTGAAGPKSEVEQGETIMGRPEK